VGGSTGPSFEKEKPPQILLRISIYLFFLSVQKMSEGCRPPGLSGVMHDLDALP
jgi:hypothetical protein